MWIAVLGLERGQAAIDGIQREPASTPTAAQLFAQALTFL
jgi:hypothetical protein